MSGRTICFVSLEIYPTTAGGVGIFLHHAAQVLLDDEINVILLLDVSQDEFERFERRDRARFRNGTRLVAYRVEHLCAETSEVSGAYPYVEQARSVRIAEALSHLHRLHQIDLVEFYDYCGPAYHYLIKPRRERAPVAIRLHNTTELIERKIRAPLAPMRIYAYAMERAQIALADYLLTPGQRYFDEEIRPLYAREVVGPRLVVSKPPHFPIGEVVPKADARDVLFYGRLSTFKGLDTFIRGAVLALRDPAFSAWLGRFVIAGPEETVASALSLAEMKAAIPRELAERFEFIGRLSHPQLVELLPDVAFACFANRMESFCYAAHELHTAGIPLVLADKPAFRDHFTDGADALFFDGTARGLAEAMWRIAADDTLRRLLAASSEGKAAAYATNFYDALLAADATPVNAASARPVDVPRLSVFVLSDGSGDAELRTSRALRHPRIHAKGLRLAGEGALSFAGQHWSLIPLDRVGNVDALDVLSEFCIFLRAGDEPDVPGLLALVDRMAEDDRVGAIATWQRIGTQLRPALHAYIPELAQAVGPGLRTLIRISAGLTTLELLAGASERDETSLLLEQRTAGRAILEAPVAAVRIDRCVPLPHCPMEQIVAADFDRISPDYFGIGQCLALPAWSGVTRAARPAAATHDGMRPATLLDPSLVRLEARPDRGPGEVWLLRLFQRPGAVHESWAAVTREGDWQLVLESSAPAGGALKTLDGAIQFNAAGGEAGFEVLRGPFCGHLNVAHGGQRYELNLQAQRVSSEVIWLSELCRGFALGANLPTLLPAGRPLSARLASLLRMRDAHTPKLVALVDEHTMLAPSRALEATHSAAVALRDFGEDRVARPEMLALDLHTFAASAEVGRFLLPFGLKDGPRIAQALLRSALASEVVVDLDSQGRYREGVAYYQRLAAWMKAIAVSPGRVLAFGSEPDLVRAFGACGTSEGTLPGRLSFREARMPGPEAELDIVLLPSGGLVEVMAHMVAAAAQVNRAHRAVRSLYVPRSQRHVREIAKALGAARWIVAYDRAEDLVLDEPDQLLIGCAAYPDPTPPPAAVEMFARGVMCALGPSGAALGPDWDDYTVPYWEDAQDIAAALERLADDPAAALDRYARAAARSDVPRDRIRRLLEQPLGPLATREACLEISQ